MICAFAQGASPLGGGTSCICCLDIRHNSHAYIEYNVDAYIIYPHTHAYIRCLDAAAAAAAAGDNRCFGICSHRTIVLAELLYLKQQCCS